MIVVALALILGGWRMGRVCVVLTLAAVGAGLCAFYAQAFGISLVVAVVGAVLLGAFGIAFKQHSVALLGGLLGAGIAAQVLTFWGLSGWAMLVTTILCFVCFAALCWSSPQSVVIVITSFEGGVLLVSGLVPILAMSPVILRFFESTNRASWMFFPFMVMVPTTVGYFLQVADSKRHASGT